MEKREKRETLTSVSEASKSILLICVADTDVKVYAFIAGNLDYYYIKFEELQNLVRTLLRNLWYASLAAEGEVLSIT